LTLKHGVGVELITIDFETYYSSEYTLSKITMEEYIRHEEFQTIGVGIKVNDGDAEWFSGTHTEIKAHLHTYDWANATAVAHNAAFDAGILSWRFDIHPHMWADTQSMARAIDGTEASSSLKACAERYKLGVKGDEVVKALGKRREEFTPVDLYRYGMYCRNDCDLTWELLRVYLTKTSALELQVIDLTIKMFSEPVLELDLPLLESHLTAVQDRKKMLIGSSAAELEVLNSNIKFAVLLRGYGVDPPTKISRTTGDVAYAFAKTDVGLQELLEHDDERVQTAVAARMGVKSTLEETRTSRLIGIAKRGPLPVPLKYFAAHTGRWGGCLIADTEVTVHDRALGTVTKRIVDVLLSDLVWDGEEFVSHDGVQFSGYQEVISWDGVTGTEGHIVFTDVGEISLRDAMQGAHRIQTARTPHREAMGETI